MIAKLTGQVESKADDSLILELDGIGYEVFVPAADWGAAKVGQAASFYIYDHVREDAHLLYGFGELAARQLFLRLLSVSGVGPRVALAVLSAANLQRLQQAIAAGDPELLRGVSGVGKKTAERIIVELRGKVEATIGGPVSSGDSAYQALVGLGYSAADAAEAVATIPAEVTDEGERIKAALKGLAK